MNKKLALALSLVLTIALLLSSAAVAEDLPKVLYFGQAYAGTALDMQISTNSGTASIADLVTESLIRFDDNNELQPILLTKLPDVSEDGLVYSFELKEGVYFTDGTELHSSDVKFTLERLFNPDTHAGSTSFFTMIEGSTAILKGEATELSGFETVDDYHFNITLEFPFAPFVKNMATSYADIFPEKATTEAGKQWGLSTNLIGTGPYKVKENDDSTEVVLIKNENYHGGEVLLDEIHFIYYDNADTKLLAYENGDIDVSDLPASQLLQYQSLYPDEVHPYNPPGTYFVHLNLKNEYLADINVRKAISLAINREELIDTILNGSGIPATSFLNYKIPGHDDSLGVYEYDPDQARQLLADAGYTEPITLNAEVREGDALTITAVQGYLQEVGINLNISIVDSATWTSDRSAGNIEVTSLSWNALFPDGDSQFYTYFYSTAAAGRSVFYASEEFDQLLDNGRLNTNEDERAELYRQADYLFSREDYVAIPLYYPQNNYLAKPHVIGFELPNLIFHFWNTDVDAAASAAVHGN